MARSRVPDARSFSASTLFCLLYWLNFNAASGFMRLVVSLISVNTAKKDPLTPALTLIVASGNVFEEADVDMANASCLLGPWERQSMLA